jgi:structural maintenance of chromosome 3 (chondroitin sulfate proteoglycan 6)
MTTNTHIVLGITVMPLNRLRMVDVDYPSSKDAFPMMERLQFDDRFRPAISQIFGKTMIVRDIHTGTLLSRKHKLDCITLEGMGIP